MGITPVYTLSEAQSLALRAESRAHCRHNNRAEAEYLRLQSMPSRPRQIASEADKSTGSDAPTPGVPRKAVVGGNNPYSMPRG